MPGPGTTQSMAPVFARAMCVLCALMRSFVKCHRAGIWAGKQLENSRNINKLGWWRNLSPASEYFDALSLIQNNLDLRVYFQMGVRLINKKVREIMA